MERLRITTPPLPPPSNSPPYEAVEGEIYVSWEAIRVSRENGRREINYYVKRKDGRLDLAVIGKEKSLRHMVYKNVLLKRPDLKLKTRREVVDWLNSIVSVSDSLPHESSQLGSYNVDDPSDMDIEGFMDLQSENRDCLGREFMWLGSPWKCRKQRKHYQSFHRNGVKISVNDFVYILAEENKQLVAYLEDMYEDCKGNKMAVVRWFHKADEVGFDLSHKFNDREIFFSLCHQDLNIECIDGLATVLSPQHLEKFNDKAIYYKWDPFVCYKQFEDDEVRLFDITRVKGYWKQEIFNSTSSVSKDSDLKVDAGICEASLGPKKRIRLSKDHECIQNTEPCGVEASNLQSRLIECKSMTSTGHPGVKSSALLPTTVAKQNPFQYFQVGSEVEVLSQDSGIRGCWFRAAIIKKHKNKVKIRYQDLKDAADEAKHLEEWVISSKIALPDGLGVRICGRTTIRPSLEFSKDGVSSFDVGAVVDVWWHDGWWEGIVIKIESEDTIHVYFPGENNTSIFDRANLRRSQEWLGHRWIHIKDRPDIATSKIIVAKLSDVKSAHVANIDNTGLTEAKAGSSDLSLDYKSGDSKKSPERQDLLKDFCLAQWKSKRKRSVCVVRSGQNDHCRNHNSESSPKPLGYDECERFPISTTLKVDMDNCKCVGDFTSAVVQSMTNLVMSR